MTRIDHATRRGRAVNGARRSPQPFIRPAIEGLEARETPALFNVQSPVTIGLLNNFGCVATGDFNNDGKQDVVMTSYGLAGPGNAAAGNKIFVRLGNGTGV